MAFAMQEVAHGGGPRPQMLHKADETGTQAGIGIGAD